MFSTENPNFLYRCPFRLYENGENAHENLENAHENDENAHENAWERFHFENALQKENFRKVKLIV